MTRKVEPLFYVKDAYIYQRPVYRTFPADAHGKVFKSVTVGFRVCTVSDGVDPAELCAMLNKAEQPPVDE